MELIRTGCPPSTASRAATGMNPLTVKLTAKGKTSSAKPDRRQRFLFLGRFCGVLNRDARRSGTEPWRLEIKL